MLLAIRLESESKQRGVRAVDLSQLIVTNAAGMVKTPAEVRELLRAQVLTHVTVGSITVDEREGNPEPNYWVSPEGDYALNARGLPCRGLPYYKETRWGEEIAALVHEAGKKLVVSIVSTQSEDDWVELAKWAVGIGANIIELNGSCPNKWRDGVREGMVADDPDAIDQVVDLVFPHINGAELSFKLPPYDARQADVIFPTLTELPIDYFVSCNTVGGFPTTIDGVQVLSMPAAGLSGPTILPQSTAQVRRLREEIPDMPVIGVGGIENGEGALEYLNAGASGFGVGTHFFNNGPRVFGEIVQDLVDRAA